MTRRKLRTVATGAALLALMLSGSRRVLGQWGATKAEARAALPGDELVPAPARTTTRAITVHAPAAHVWRWLVQIGQDRGGMYSYDWLENLVGLHIHSTHQIRPEWQQLAVGDQIRLIRQGWFGLKDGYALAVAHLVPTRTLVLYDASWPAIWSFHIRAMDAGSCRLISRGRGPCTTRTDSAVDFLVGPVEFAMSRRMLLGIKQRAESAVNDPFEAQAPVPEPAGWHVPGLSPEPTSG